MKKHPKIAYGILEDGKSVKLVALQRDVYQVYLTDLHKIDLDQALYSNHEHYSGFDTSPDAGSQTQNGDLVSSEFTPEYAVKINPWDNLFNAVQLEKGVLALNVNEDRIVRGAIIPKTKGEVKELVRAHLTPRQYRAGEWQTSVVDLGGVPQYWLHLGDNKLLDMLRFHAKKQRKRLYYQLADANDIALTDYYRIYHLDDNKRVLLVYLGLEYRKAFLFDKGKLVDILQLSISQEFPDQELIMSRLNLALDNAQQAEPDLTVLCGDLASESLAAYFNQNGTGSTQLLTYPLLSYDTTKAQLTDPTLLAQCVLPIALAYKALFPDEERFTPNNFLPRNLILAQKPFKLDWHGMALIAAIFALSFFGTSRYLSSYERLNKAREEKRDLDRELAILSKQAEEITLMREKIRQFDENLKTIRTVLVGKNPWSVVLETINRLFRVKPVSWLTNFKLEGTRLNLTGITTNRNHVIDFAEALPNSRIKKVTSTKIRDYTVWNFELVSDLPTVDWVGQIEAEIAEFIEQNRIEEERSAAQREEERLIEAARQAEEQRAAAAKLEAQRLAARKQEAAPPPTKPVAPKQDKPQAKPQQPPAKAKPASPSPPAPTPKTQAAKPPASPAPATTAALVQTLPGRTLPPIPAQFMPQPNPWQRKANPTAIAEYNAFVAAVNAGDKEEFSRLGDAYIAKYPLGRLTNLLRWHYAYRLYRDGYLTLAREILDEQVREVDEIYPHSVLLAARIDYAKGKKRAYRLYRFLDSQYQKHPLHPQIAADIALLGPEEEQ